MTWRRDKTSKGEKDNRIKVVLAIIFLFGAASLGKLFILQIKDFKFYSAKADNQHLVEAILEPERGRIFLSDNSAEGVFPIAANKKFAYIYAVPKDIVNPKRTAEELYYVFKKEKIEKEVESEFKKKDNENINNELKAIKDLEPEEKKVKEEEIKKKYDDLFKDATWQELRKIKIESEINIRKEEAINEYLKSLSKKDDPYEPLEKKVEEDILKKLYSIMSSDILQPLNSESEIGSTTMEEGITHDNLEIQENSIYYKDSKNEKKELKIPGVGFIMKLMRYYPEGNIGSHLTGFVSLNEVKQVGNYGLEGFFENELRGSPGSIKTERGAGGDLIIINDREYHKPQNGSDLVLTIDRTIQFTVCDKLNKAVLRHGADGGSAIVMNPKTGEILAMCSYPDFDPNKYSEVANIKVFNNPAIFNQYEPGSIFKVITMAMGLDQEKITPDTTFNDSAPVKIANYTIENSDKKSHGVVTMTNVLEQSLNTGAIFVARKVGLSDFKNYIKAFGFGEKTGIELEGEGKGNIRNLDDKLNPDLNLYTASFGQGISVTPIQMVNAFSTIANGGVMMKPYIVKEIIKNDGTKDEIQPHEIGSIISARAAILLGGMMVNVVENGHGKKAGVKGYWVAGKTGTAQVYKKDGRGYEANAHIGSFAGFAPADNPKFAMLVRIDNPRDVEWAESSAAPLFGEISEFLLNYWQIPSERKIEKK